ncbi:DNA polymerase Y family protein, partial [Sporichthya sp.]|uniref:DNA polymerase Y family protein n=1 Tax=Sporichthya sp. TaxID=65475 RepID=UPI0017A99769
CRAGVAEGAFAAALAARVGQVVPAGRTPEFLAPYPVDVLDRPDLADLLRRLGLRTLGDFGGLPPADVTARFGADGGFAHRLARGEDPLPPDARTPPPDLIVSTHLDPPAEQVERAAFAARPLADQLHARLTAAGLGCTRLIVEAETEHGERYERVWRYEGVLDAAAIADRVRWQLDGWLTSRQKRPSGGISVIRLAPDEVIPHGGDQLGLWTHGADAEAAERAARALVRVQGMLGQPAVLTAVLAGGRGPGERIRYVAWGDPRGAQEENGPWPGRIPAPSPALVPPTPVPAQLVDDVGQPISINSRYAISASPSRLRVGDEAPRPVLSWAGPWPAEERWWDAGAAAVKVRVQVATADGTGWLLISQGGRWFVEAVYD